jgi:putative membrane protein
LTVPESKEPYRSLIIVLSVAIPVIVAVLFRVEIDGYDFSYLPPIYASINGLTAVLLMVSYVAIRNGNRTVHERINKLCMAFSATFLVMYVLYHMTSEETSYGGEGWLRPLYYFILISHILLSVAVVPLILFTFSRALAGNFDRHRRLAKFAFPVWLYVAVTGVLVYLMISPYYT